MGTAAFTSGVGRVIARVYPSGAVDTSLLVADAPAGGLFASVASPDGASAFYAAFTQYTVTSTAIGATPSPQALTNGVRYCTASGGGGTACGTAGASVQVYDAWPVTSLLVVNATLYVAKPSLPGGGGAGETHCALTKLQFTVRLALKVSVTRTPPSVASAALAACPPLPAHPRRCKCMGQSRRCEAPRPARRRFRAAARSGSQAVVR